jgi:transglutaminase-like putative cysteine protease
MADLVNASLKRPTVRILTHRILSKANLSSRDETAIVRAVYNWIKRNIRYVKDPVGVETIQSPEITLRVRAGDCDDHVVLISSMLKSVGVPVRYSVVGKSRDRFSHINLESFIGDRWTATDTTIAGPMGRMASLPVRKVYDLDNNGLGGYMLAGQQNESGAIEPQNQFGILKNPLFLIILGAVAFFIMGKN